MLYYLLKWNPSAWPAEKFDEYFEKFERGETLRWSCGTTKKIVAGDRFFLMKTGKDGRGIIGSGVILSAPFKDEHYDEERARANEQARFVDIKFDYLTKSGATIPITSDELNAPELETTVWKVQGSGKTIPNEVAKALTKLWESRVKVQDFASRVKVLDFASPDELDSVTETLPEGAKKQVTVNAYERSPEARRQCLIHWGYDCSVCQFRFDLAYGVLGENYIHVHHLRPISKIGATYEINPIEDLRPVCPNCHAMLHKKSPPMSIEELRKIVDTQKSESSS